MQKSDQIRILRELMQGSLRMMELAVEHGDVPENWDGHELREWAAERLDRQRSKLLRDGRTARARNYHDDVLVHNL